MSTTKQDLLYLLAREHREYRERFHQLIDELLRLPGRKRRRGFGSFMVRTCTHMIAEDLLVHPLVEAGRPDGPVVVGRRRSEAVEIHRALVATGQRLEADAEAPALESLQEASRLFAVHADHEELDGYLTARREAATTDLRRLASLHQVLRKRVPAQYLRTAPQASQAPWNDPELMRVIRSWYRAELTDRGWTVAADDDTNTAMPDSTTPKERRSSDRARGQSTN